MGAGMTRALFCLLTLSAALAACAPATAWPAPAPGTLFSDDFTNPLSGWDRHSAPDITTDYAGGRYLIAVEPPGIDVWATPGLSFADAALEVNAVHAAGPAGDEYGLLCRFRRSGDQASFYFFVIRADGTFAAGKVIKNTRSVLSSSSGGFTPLRAIHTQAGALNRLAAACAGNEFSFQVNGLPAAAFADESLTQGEAGLLAGTFEAGGLKVLFDDFTVRPS